MTAAAENPAGGGAAEGMGLGVGMAMASQMVPGFGGAGARATAATPPPPPVVVWHVAVAGQTKGPFTPEQLAAMIASGEVRGASMVWTPGMQAWSPASTVPQLAGYFAAMTPPPPPPA